MNPIAQAFHDADPDYVPNEYQQRAIDNPDSQKHTAEEIAEGIPQQIESFRAVLAVNLGVDRDQILPSDVMDEVITHHKSIGYASYNRGLDLDENFYRKLSRDKAYEIGLRLGNESVDPITMVYRAILKRDPDPSGYAYWMGQYNSGVSLSKVTWHIENSDEANA